MPPPGPPADDGEISANTVVSALADTLADVICVLDDDGHIVDTVCHCAESTTAVKDQLPMGAHVSEAFASELGTAIAAELDRVLSKGTATRFDRRLSDSGRWYEVCLAPIRTGQSPSVVCVVHDITEYRKKERQLQDETEVLMAALDATEDLVYVYDQNGKLRQWNDALERTTGYSKAELAGANPTMFFPDSETERILETFVDAFRQGHARVEAPLVTADRGEVPYQFTANTAETATGERVLCGIGRDITERIERDQQIGVLSRVLRHNVRNKMTVVSGQTESLRARAPVSMQNGLASIQQAATDLQHISEKTLDITRLLLDQPSIEPVQLGADIRTITETMRERHPEARFDIDVPPSLTALAIPEFGRAVRELLENACEHNDAPTVTISAAVEEETIRLRVCDDGGGLPPNEENVITQARPMTSVFHGVGMGLWLVRWVVKLSNGSVTSNNCPETGACFEITLSTVPSQSKE